MNHLVKYNGHLLKTQFGHLALYRDSPLTAGLFPTFRHIKVHCNFSGQYSLVNYGDGTYQVPSEFRTFGITLKRFNVQLKELTGGFLGRAWRGVLRLPLNVPSWSAPLEEIFVVTFRTTEGLPSTYADTYHGVPIALAQSGDIYQGGDIVIRPNGDVFNIRPNQFLSYQGPCGTFAPGMVKIAGVSDAFDLRFDLSPDLSDDVSWLGKWDGVRFTGSKYNKKAEKLESWVGNVGLIAYLSFTDVGQYYIDSAGSDSSYLSDTGTFGSGTTFQMPLAQSRGTWTNPQVLQTTGWSATPIYATDTTFEITTD